MVRETGMKTTATVELERQAMIQVHHHHHHLLILLLILVLVLVLLLLLRMRCSQMLKRKTICRQPVEGSLKGVELGSKWIQGPVHPPK